MSKEQLIAEAIDRLTKEIINLNYELQATNTHLASLDDSIIKGFKHVCENLGTDLYNVGDKISILTDTVKTQLDDICDTIHKKG